MCFFFFFSSRRRHTRSLRDWSSDVCSSDLAGCLAAAMAGAAATPALADYGTGARYQVEISANNVGGVPGDGVWLWIEMNSNGTGDYTGSDCIHTGPAGLNGAA